MSASPIHARGACHCGAVRFTLDQGHDALEIREQNEVGERVRCATCGVIPFGRGDLPELGGAFVSVNVRCLEGVELSGVPVLYLDGGSDTWALIHARPWRSPFLPEAA